MSVSNPEKREQPVRRESGFRRRTTWGTPMGALRLVVPLATGRHPTYVARWTEGGDLVIAERIEAKGPVERARVTRIARRLAALRDPNVVPVHAVEASAEEVVVVSELLEAERYDTVSDMAADTHRPMPLELHLRVLIDVLSGLHTLHALRDTGGPLGLVHGDVCSANVMLCTDGNAKLVHAAHPGKPRAGVRDDVQSCGLMLWQALSGRRFRHVPARPTLPLLEPWAAPLTSVASRAAAPDPKDRYASVAELAADLRRLAGAHIASKAALRAFVIERCGERIQERRGELLADAAVAKAEVAIAPESTVDPEEETQVDMRAILVNALARAMAAEDAEEPPTRVQERRAYTVLPPSAPPSAPAPAPARAPARSRLLAVLAVVFLVGLVAGVSGAMAASAYVFPQDATTR
jgi:hypothetical protein